MPVLNPYVAPASLSRLAALRRCYATASHHAQTVLPTIEPERRLLIVLDVGHRLAEARGLA